VQNIEEACARFESLGVPFKKRLTDGKMRHIAFILDPDGYVFMSNKYRPFIISLTMVLQLLGGDRPWVLDPVSFERIVGRINGSSVKLVILYL
jgi:hypothetical protein